MEKIKSCLGGIKDAIVYLLLFIGVLFAGGIFLLVGICAGIFSAICAALRRFWHWIKDRGGERGKFPIKSKGKCSHVVSTVGKVMVLVGVMGVIKVITRGRGQRN